MNKLGKFLVIEGPDGSGKTTQLQFLEDYLKDCGLEVVVVREPGGTVVGEGIRTLFKENFGQTAPMAEVFMLLAAKVQLCREVIQPALQRGAWVISDRFTPSLFAYQGAGQGVNEEVLSDIVQLALDTGHILNPDATVFLQVSSAEQQNRLQARTDELDKIDTAPSDFTRRVRHEYSVMSTGILGYPLGHIYNVDADPDPFTVRMDVLEAFRWEMRGFDSELA